MRPGEKLYEELLISGEDNLPTHHPKILIGKVISTTKNKIDKDIKELVELARSENAAAIVAKMKEILPEYKSANSEFENLDLKVKL